MNLYCGDCLDVLPKMSDESVHAVIADLPYGETQLEWDSIIPLEPLWTQLKRVIKPRGSIVLSCAQPFTSKLIMSNPEWFKYCWIWNKKIPTGIFNAKLMPLKQHEEIAVFCEKLGGTYNPQKHRGKFRNKGGVSGTKVYGKCEPVDNFNDEYHPMSILEFSNAVRDDRLHPTQKPIDLFKYLVLTYTNAGEIVLDCTMGSGTTGEAAISTGRDFIGIERDEKYFSIAKSRIEDAVRAFNGSPKQMKGSQSDFHGLPLMEMQL